MESLQWRIMPLTDDEFITLALDDMARAGRYAAKQQAKTQASRHEGHCRSMSTGVAVIGLGMQLTPMDSPIEEETDTFGEIGAHPLVGFH